MKYVMVGVNHRTAPLSLREKLAFAPEKLEEAYSKLLGEKEILEEGVILSTCNRIEIYARASHPAQAVLLLKNFISEFHGLSLEQVSSHFYSHIQEEAILQGFRVASGLDSMVLGESQVLAQMKEAYQIAQELGAVGPALNRFFPKAFHVAKKIRSETEIASFPVSISYVAVLLAKQIFGTLEGKKALLIGAGKMGELAAKHLRTQGKPEIWVANRNFEKACQIAEACEGHALEFQNYLSALPQMDVVITSTSASDYLLKPEQIQEAMRIRKNLPMFLIDIAVPRNIDPSINNLSNVYLYDLDDLKAVIEDNLQARKVEAAKGEEIIQKEAVSFLQELKTLSVVPTIQLLAQKFEQIRTQECEKTLNRLKNLTNSDREMLEALTQAIVNKILHDPLLTLKNEVLESEEGYSSSHEAIKKLFRLEKKT